jgi:hypothetical protein
MPRSSCANFMCYEGQMLSGGPPANAKPLVVNCIRRDSTAAHHDYEKIQSSWLRIDRDGLTRATFIAGCAALTLCGPLPKHGGTAR